MEPSLSDIPIVCDYPEVFPEEFLGLPPQREIEFAIDVVPSATPTSITPYRMAPVELKELKLVATPKPGPTQLADPNRNLGTLG